MAEGFITRRSGKKSQELVSGNIIKGTFRGDNASMKTFPSLIGCKLFTIETEGEFDDWTSNALWRLCYYNSGGLVYSTKLMEYYLPSLGETSYEVHPFSGASFDALTGTITLPDDVKFLRRTLYNYIYTAYFD